MTAPGLEGILARELRGLGISLGKSVSGGVEFKGSREELWRANLWSRTANRVVERVAEFHASTFHELERRAKKIEWNRYLSAGSSVRFRVTARKSKLYHSDAVAERLGTAAGKAGAVVAQDADDDESENDAQLFIVRIANDICSISADSSGALLHRRGYRQAIAKAPLRETLGAAMLLGSGWSSSKVLVDPMCGSGTIAIEGAMIARNIAPGIGRKFAFEQWPDHDKAKWRALGNHAKSSERSRAEPGIFASDRDAGATTATIENANRAGVLEDIEVENRSLSEVDLPDREGWIVTNPPYGLRIGESGRLRNLYARLGQIVREAKAGYTLGLLSADKALDAQLGIALEEVFRTTNGGIPVRMVVGKG
ncbi:MAG TPA: hypothetical protein VFD22_06920 [Gemmatimonadaceae bacterium]|nr:hypothetical protein [Gemmatimonadaceae bacterium]